MNLNSPQGVYQTKDLYLASLLFTQHLKLIKLVKQENFFWFVFEDKTKAEELSALFWNRNVLVDAKAYAEAVRCLKDMIFARKE